MPLEGIWPTPTTSPHLGSQQGWNWLPICSAIPDDWCCRGPQLRGRLRSVPGLSVRGRARRHGRAAGAGGADEAIAAVQRAGNLAEFLYTIPNFREPAALPDLGPADRGAAGGRAGSTCSWWRTSRTVCWASRATPPGDAFPRRRAGRLPGFVLQDLRTGLPGRLGAGAGRGPGNWCSPRSRRPARRPSPSWRRLPGEARLEGQVSSSVRCTGSGATPAGRLADHMPAGSRGRCRPAASSSG